MSDSPLRILLGPQNPVRHIGDAVNVNGLPDGQVAVISAAWQEAENDIDDVRALVGRPLVDLELYRRADEVFRNDSKLAVEYRRRQDRLKERQRIYRSRLRPLAFAARRMLDYEGDRYIVAAERRHAIAQLRALDRHHLNGCESMMQRFHAEFDPLTYDLLAAHAREIRAIVEASAGVLITGGNVAILINRLRLFGLRDLLRQVNIVAWSAGAMVLAERIVLYHERLPQGRRNAEVFGTGLGLLPGYVFLPDARHRLRPGDRLRNSLLARRFAPDVCVALDNATSMRWAGNRLEAIVGVRRLSHTGKLTEMQAA